MLRRLDWGYRQKRGLEPRLRDPGPERPIPSMREKAIPLGIPMTIAAIIDEERSTAGVVVSCPAFGLSPSFANRCTSQTPDLCAEFRPAGLAHKPQYYASFLCNRRFCRACTKSPVCTGVVQKIGSRGHFLYRNPSCTKNGVSPKFESRRGP